MKNQVNLAVIAFLLVVTSIPLLGLYYPVGHDWIYELVRVAEFNAALRDNQYPPFWAPNLYGGMGSPIFLYYAPLYAFISNLFIPITNNIETSSSLALIVISGAGIYFMYLFLRELLQYYNLSHDAALRIGLYIFSFSPYLFADKFLRNANAEYTALCIAPLVFYGIFKIARQPGYGVLIVAAGIALTVLAHNLTALVVAAFSIVVIVALYIRSQAKYFFSGIGGLVLGLGISLFFWLPALFYMSFVRINELTSGKFDYHTQFKDVYDYFGYSSFYSVGGLTPLILFLAFIAIILATKKYMRKDLANALVFVLIAAVILIFLMSRSSVVLWENAPFLSLFQFPWRMMGPLAIVIAAAGALIAAYTFSAKYVRNYGFAELLVLLICIANVFPVYSHVKTTSYVTSVNLHKILTPDCVKTGFLPATVRDEYLPNTANTNFYTNAASGSNGVRMLIFGGQQSCLLDRKNSIYITSLNGSIPIDQVHFGKSVVTSPPLQNKVYPTISNSSEQGTEISFTIDDLEPGAIHFARWYFPGWAVYINNDNTEIYADNLGLLSVEYPAGKHTIRAKISAPNHRQVCIYISGLFFGMWVLMLFLHIARDQVKPRSAYKLI